MKENASTKAAYFKQGATCQALFKINVFQISSKSPSTLAPSRILANAHRRLPSVGRPPETSHTLGLRGRAPRISRLTSAGRAKQRLQRRRSADTFLLSQMRHFRFARLPMSPRRLVRLTHCRSAASGGRGHSKESKPSAARRLQRLLGFATVDPQPRRLRCALGHPRLAKRHIGESCGHDGCEDIQN